MYSALGLHTTVPQMRSEMSRPIKENWRNVQVLVIKEPHWEHENCKREVNVQLGQGWEHHADLQDVQILHGQKGSR